MLHQERDANDVHLMFSHMVVEKLLEGQWIVFPETLASLSDDQIASTCNLIRRPGGFVSGMMSYGGNQVYVLAVKNLKFDAFVFDPMECCSVPYDITSVNKKEVLNLQNQWELENRRTPKGDKNN